jgi:hypothetical protein
MYFDTTICLITCGSRSIKKRFCFSLSVFFLLSFLILTTGCNTAKIHTAWQGKNIIPRGYSKLLVVGIVKDSGFALRQQIEKTAVDELKMNGFNAVSSIEEFGPHGLANLEREETYRRLFKKDIGAIITITLIDKKKEKQFAREKINYTSDLFFYDRIWNYKDIEADITAAESLKGKQYSVESIFFDIATLEALYTMETKPLSIATFKRDANIYAKRIVNELLKKKGILSKGNARPVKAF